MRTWLRDLDRILRGEATRLTALRRGTIEIPAGGLSVVIVLLGMVQGLCMGCFALFKGGGPVYLQMIASAIKVPALFFLTLLVTLPSLYVFNALVGSRLSLSSLVRLLVASLGVMMASLASLGPIVAFFSIITTSYPFMVLLNVAVFSVAGFLGLVFLLRTLHRLSIAVQELPESEAAPVELLEISDEPKGPPPPRPREGALDRLEDRVLGRHVKTVFRCWVVLFGLVGAQMAWVLRPFIGNPGQPFTWLRPRQSNFFEAVFHAIGRLFS
jgi:hypothetical protein